MMQDSENPFWTFSLALYEREGVAAACLGLQERRDLDVNVLLFCCWAGTRGRSLSGSEVADLIGATREWREQVVRPLRGARRWLKTQAQDPGSASARLREDIKTAELSAEAIEQAMLHRALPLPEGAPAPNAVAGNLRAYLAALGQATKAADTSDLAALLLGACPALRPLDAIRLLDARPD